MHERTSNLFMIGCVLFLLSDATSAFAKDRGESSPPPPVGFLPQEVAAQIEREHRYLSTVQTNHLREWMQKMTVRPHHAGSPPAKANAHFIAELFRSWGFETEIEVFHVLFPTPKVLELERISPDRAVLNLTEEIVADDSAAAALREEALAPYNAYSADGEVTAPLVFVNRGVPDDYRELERRGIDVAGKIVLARYGGSWRGIKAKVAAERGAVGCLIYNDPADDGYGQGDPYPKGAFKHPTAVQRGSVVDLPLRPGDPLTPDRGATLDAARLDIAESETIMKIPVLPISAATGLELISKFDGPLAPPSWRGALPATYRLGGGGGLVVRLKAEFHWDLVPAYNVIARMKGAVFPDQWVIRGNHHDAWVIGARDPISGLVTVLEQARGFSELAKSGWRPKRTVIFCAWDAEEPGLLGSTEWVEHHAEELIEHAVAYVNTDGNGRGFLRIGGSHALESLASDVAARVVDPQTGVSVLERWRASRLVHGSREDREKLRARAGLRLSALGSGSDYSAFLQHLGVASFNLGFGGEGKGGEYHTCFDTFDHYRRFIDPSFEYGAALARMCGLLTLRLADATILPFDFGDAERTIQGYIAEVVELADDLRRETEETNRLLEEGIFAIAADPTETDLPLAKQDPVPFFDFSPLLNAGARLERSVQAFEKVRSEVLATDGSSWTVKRLRDLNRVLYRSERALIHQEGLPRRPWFRHLVYAPGFYTGYGVKTLPGVREGIEQRKWEETRAQITITGSGLFRFADSIDAAAEIMRSGLSGSSPDGS